VENIFHHHNATTMVFVGFLVENLILACFLYLARTHAYAKLFGALGALKHQLLTSLVLGFVKSDITITFGTTYTLHD
jgi:hypothetical protein